VSPKKALTRPAEAARVTRLGEPRNERASMIVSVPTHLMTS